MATDLVDELTAKMPEILRVSGEMWEEADNEVRDLERRQNLRQGSHVYIHQQVKDILEKYGAVGASPNRGRPDFYSVPNFSWPFDGLRLRFDEDPTRDAVDEAVLAIENLGGGMEVLGRPGNWTIDATVPIMTTSKFLGWTRNKREGVSISAEFRSNYRPGRAILDVSLDLVQDPTYSAALNIVAGLFGYKALQETTERHTIPV